jgi:hypothetical protein
MSALDHYLPILPIQQTTLDAALSAISPSSSGERQTVDQEVVR